MAETAADGPYSVALEEKFSQASHKAGGADFVIGSVQANFRLVEWSVEFVSVSAPAPASACAYAVERSSRRGNQHPRGWGRNYLSHGCSPVHLRSALIVAKDLYLFCRPIRAC